MNFTTKLKGRQVDIQTIDVRDEVSWQTAEIKWWFKFDVCEWGVADFQINIDEVDIEYDLNTEDEQGNQKSLGTQKVTIKGGFCKVGKYCRLTENNQLTCIIPSRVEYKHGESKCEVEF